MTSEPIQHISSASDFGKVALRGITKTFGQAQVLRNVNIEIQGGDFLTVVGPSGCGKSTLLRIIAGLEPQDEGTVSIGGTVVDALAPKQRDIAMVFQSFALYPHLTVFDNIAVPLRMRHLSLIQRLPGVGWMLPGKKRADRQIAQHVQEVARTLHIEGFLQQKPNQLSGGQKQRVALGRAMVRRPKVFLMDEPLSNLDAELRVAMRAEIVQLHRSMQSTFIYVTHDQAEAMTMSDQVAVLMNGELLQVDTPQNIYHEPTDIRVAQFIGSPQINILPGSVEDQGVINVLGKKLPIRCDIPGKANVHVGIRPTALNVASENRDAGFGGRIRLIENLGSDVFLHVELEGLENLVIVRTNPVETDRYGIDAKVELSMNVEHILIFDKRGQCISGLKNKPSLAQKSVAENDVD